MNKSFKQAVKDKVSAHKLTQKQLNALQQKSVPVSNQIKEAKFSRIKIVGLAASILFAAFLVNWLTPLKNNSVPETMAQKIANEIVTNHMKLKPLEIHTNTLNGLIHYFTQLEFLLRPSSETPDYTQNLLGGRYCSLQGNTAAQLRFKTSSDRYVDTIYQTDYRKELFGNLPDIDNQQKPVVAWSKGIKVRIWVEKGILFAATDMAASKQD